MNLFLFLLQVANEETHITWPVVASGLATVLLIVLSAFCTILWYEMQKLERRIEHLESELSSMKTNYLSRFEEIKECITEKHLKLMEKITILTTLITPHNKALFVNKLKKDANGE